MLPLVNNRSGKLRTEKRYLTGPKVDERYGITSMTRWRWMHNETLGFPKPIVVNRRQLFELEQLEAWERKRAAAQASNREAA
jgi:predicted DNA-binding transcriptional regulator AlpA